MMHTTIHHIRPDAPRDIRHALMFGELLPSKRGLEEFYAPAETVLDVAEAGKAYHHGQGHVVNREQGGRHMVCSTSSGDVLEMHDDDGEVTLWRVDRIGFTELPIEEPPENDGAMPHEEPLLA